jgi:peptidyl-prolyl cis-trans isomerase C
MRRTKRIGLGIGIATAVLASGAVLAQTPTATHASTSSARADAAPPSTGDAVLSPEERARRATPVAHVGEAVVTVGELEDMLNEAPQPVRQSYADPARRREFLENMIQTILLAQEAQRRGLDRQPEASASIRRILAQRLEQSAIIEAITPESVSDADVRAYYDQHIGDYQQPEFRRATVVFTDDRAAADQVAQALRSARGDMRRVQAIVRDRSTDALTREHDGDLFYFRRDGVASGTPQGQTTVDRAIAMAAFGLAREMDVAEPVHAANGKWAVVVLTGIRPAFSRQFTDVGVAASIRGYIVRERRSTREREMLEELRTRLHPEVHEELLDQIHLPASDLGNVPPFQPGAVPRRAPTPTGASPVPPAANPNVIRPVH